MINHPCYTNNFKKYSSIILNFNIANNKMYFEYYFIKPIYMSPIYLLITIVDLDHERLRV